MQKQKSPHKDLSRRSFMKFILGLLGTAAALEIGGISLAYLKSRSDENQSGGLVLAGPLADFAPDSVTPFEREGFFLIRDAQGDFLAVHQRCPHLGCNVLWQPDRHQFVCPCHASAYDIRGEVIRPPAPRALDIYPMFIENNVVKVDTGRLIRRSEFRAEQVVYPKVA